MNRIAIAAVTGSLLIGAWAGGCGGHPSDISCDEREATPHVCVLYGEVMVDQQADVKATCTNAAGTVGGACPTANVLGICTITAGGAHTSETYYSEGGETADMAQTDCTSNGGTWTGH